MTLAERLEAAANGDVEWRKALLLEAAALARIEADRPRQGTLARVRRTESRKSSNPSPDITEMMNG